MPLPWADIDAVFLDVGGTLVTMDFDRISRELAGLGVTLSAEALRRGEARARPEVSRALGRANEDRPGGGRGEGGRPRDLFVPFLTLVLAHSLPADAPERERPDALAERLAPSLRFAEGSRRLWSSMIPGVVPFLNSLKALGLPLAVVSNSDGSVARGLAELGIAGYFRTIVDSGTVGVEKPDPRIFGYALEALDVAPERTIHVGDLYGPDVEGARSAGIHPVLVDPHGDWPDVDCEKVGALTEIAEKLAEARRGEEARS